MRLTGKLLQVEPYSGTMTGDDGQPFDYSGTRLHVLDGVEVIKVKVKASTPLPDAEPGDDVDLAVKVAANSGRSGAYLTTELISEWSSAPVGASSF